MFQEFYSKLSEQEKKIFYAAVIVATLALFDLLFLRPVSSKIHTLDEEIVEKKNALKRDVRFLAYKDKIMNEEEVLSIFQTDQSQTQEEIIAGFLKTIELLATEAKINLSKINPADVVAKKGFVEYFATLDCEGKLEDVLQFVHKVDETKNLLKVVKVDMSGNKASADGVKASMKVVKLVIDPKTIGNYELTPADAKQALEEAAAEEKIKKSGGKPEATAGEKTKSDDAGRGQVPSGESNAEGRAGVRTKGTGSAGGPGAENSGSSTEKDGAGSPGADEPAEAAVRGPLIGKENSSAKKKDARESPTATSKSDEQKSGLPSSKKMSKAQEGLKNVGAGGRVEVEGIEDLWGRFFGGKPKAEDSAGVDSPAEDSGGDTPPEGQDPNLWQRKFKGR